MPFRPRPIVWTSSELRVRLRRAKLRDCCIGGLLEEFGVIVTRRVELRIAIVKLQRTLPFRIEIQSALNRQGPDRFDRKRRIIAVFDGDVDLARRVRIKIDVQILRRYSLSSAVHAHTADRAALKFVAVLVG